MSASCIAQLTKRHVLETPSKATTSEKKQTFVTHPSVRLCLSQLYASETNVTEAALVASTNIKYLLKPAFFSFLFLHTRQNLNMCFHFNTRHLSKITKHLFFFMLRFVSLKWRHSLSSKEKEKQE